MAAVQTGGGLREVYTYRGRSRNHWWLLQWYLSTYFLSSTNAFLKVFCKSENYKTKKKKRLFACRTGKRMHNDSRGRWTSRLIGSRLLGLTAKMARSTVWRNQTQVFRSYKIGNGREPHRVLAKRLSQIDRFRRIKWWEAETRGRNWQVTLDSIVRVMLCSDDEW